jgi:hypothetical protein
MAQWQGIGVADERGAHSPPQDLNALGDVAGAVSKGLPDDVCGKLPRMRARHLRQQCSCAKQQGQQRPAAGHLDTAHTPKEQCGGGGCKCAAAHTM